jgi:asparagine synthase (glutamine-hydrolysing)
MCGIAGFYGAPQDNGRYLAVLQKMISALDHRGPDERGLYLQMGVGLGHARLSVIDLSSGQQPMSDADESLWVTFNGEIFNYLELQKELTARGHLYRTRSDTETILHQYAEDGTACVESFNGDFAFALWDKRRDRMVLARDRMGVRPVYWTIQDGILVFGSEIKALLEFPGVSANIDPLALDQCFTFWFPIAPRTPFKGIYELPPGHILIAEGRNVRVQCYWQLNYPDAADDRPMNRHEEEAVAEELHALLLDATRIRLRADVAVGAYLSGGLDSSVLTALIRRTASSPLRTFSVGFESAEFDETHYQQEVVRALRTDHQAVLCTQQDIGRIFPDVIRHAERPILRTAPAPLYQLAGLVRQNGYKVVLTGEGADEILAGYDIFKEAKIRRFWARQPNSSRRPLLLRRLYPYLAGIQGQSPAYLQAFFGTGLQNPDDSFFSHLPRWNLTARLKTFFSDDLRDTLQGYDAIEELRGALPSGYRRWHPLSQAQYLEAAYLLPGYILSSQGDRMAMAHGVEGRFPFLDHRLVEFAARIPPRLKIKALKEKHILRESMRRHLPQIIADRPKQPYRAPDSESFFTGKPPDYVEELLSPKAIARAGYFNPQAVGHLVAKCRNQACVGSRDNMALVGMLSVQLLEDLFVRGSGVRSLSSAAVVTN